MDTSDNKNIKTSNTQTASNPAQNVPSDKVVMGIFAYLGPLVIVSYMVAKDNPFVKFHIKQGLVLFTIEAIVWLLSIMMPALGALLTLVNIITLVFIIIGVVNVSKGIEKELQFIGRYSKFFPI